MTESDNELTQDNAPPAGPPGGVLALVQRVRLSLAGMGTPGIVLAYALMIGLVGLAMLGMVLALLLLQGLQASPLGQLVALSLLVGGLLSGFAAGAAGQMESRAGLLRLAVLGLLLALGAWLLVNSGLVDMAAFLAGFREDPIGVTMTLLLLYMITTAVLYNFHRFIAAAYSSPWRFIKAVGQMVFWALVVIWIVWVILFSGYMELQFQEIIITPEPEGF